MRIWDGDGDGNAVVDMGAYEYFVLGDLDANRVVDPLDLFIFQDVWHGTTPPGDMNHDRQIDARDLILFKQSFGSN